MSVLSFMLTLLGSAARVMLMALEDGAGRGAVVPQVGGADVHSSVPSNADAQLETAIASVWLAGSSLPLE